MNCSKCNADLSPDARFCGVCGHAAQASQPQPASTPGELAPDMVGREIAGRYRILAKLGEGGMGAVFRAEQMALKRTVALKLLRPELSANAELVRRFHAEAELAAKLNHPNTVDVYDFGQDSDGTLFIAMEFVKGRSLRDVVAREGALPAGRALAIGAEIAASLADAHAHGIVHRDLKPDNVMLSERGKQKDIVSVLDFGIAKLRDPGGSMTQMPMTQAGALIGTPQYMAPEQILGKAVDGRTDIYALGAILYEMVTGKMPFEAPSLMAMLSSHLMESPVPPSQRRPDLGISPAVDQVILAALQKAPEHRPASMEEFGEMLAALARPGGPGAVGYSDVAMATSGQPMSGAMPVMTPMPISTPAPVSTPAYMSGAGSMPAMGQPAHAAMTPQPGQVWRPDAGVAMSGARKSRRHLWLGLGVMAAGAVAVAAVLVMQLRKNEGETTETEWSATGGQGGTTGADHVQREVVSTDFFVAPKREIYANEGANNEAADGPSGSATEQRYVHPSHGYSLLVPSGFAEQPSGDPNLVAFVGAIGGRIAMIVVVHVDVDPRGLDDSSQVELARALAASTQAEVVSTSFRRIQGERRLTGIADDPANQLRYEFAILPGRDGILVVMAGVAPDMFERSAAMRQELFDRRFHPGPGSR